MPRQKRKSSEFMHIIVRGVGKQIIFEDSSDRRKYLSCLLKYRDETGISILAYCLMENHVHLLIQDFDSSCSIFMKKIGVSYAAYFNKKYERTGHLFQDRFIGETIQGEAGLLSVFRYILNNPKKAGICIASRYRWSSYWEYGKCGGLTDTSLIRSRLGDRDRLNEFLQIEDNEFHADIDRHLKDDEWAKSVIRSTLKIKSGTELQQLDRQSRNEAILTLKLLGVTIRQIERLTGISKSVIQRVR